MSYVDDLLPLYRLHQKKNYLAHAMMSANIFKDYGALKLVENWGG